MIKIYTVSDKRPDFIRLQKEGFENYLYDKNYEFIVCNNGSSDQLRNDIHNICEELSIKVLFVEGIYTDGATATQVPIQYCLKHYISKDSKENITVIIDSDIFPFAPFSFMNLLHGNEIAGIYQQRDYKKFLFKQNHYYLWNALMIFNNSKINFSDFDISSIPGVTDVGGETHFYFKENKTKVKWLQHTADIETEEKAVFAIDLKNKYKEIFGMQIIANSLIHYYRGSNWDLSDTSYHTEKTEFLLNFLDFAKHSFPLENSELDKFSTMLSHSEKHYNGQRGNYKLIKKPFRRLA